MGSFFLALFIIPTNGPDQRRTTIKRRNPSTMSSMNCLSLLALASSILTLPSASIVTAAAASGGSSVTSPVSDVVTSAILETLGTTETTERNVRIVELPMEGGTSNSLYDLIETSASVESKSEFSGKDEDVVVLPLPLPIAQQEQQGELEQQRHRRDETTPASSSSSSRRQQQQQPSFSLDVTVNHDGSIKAAGSVATGNSMTHKSPTDQNVIYRNELSSMTHVRHRLSTMNDGANDGQVGSGLSDEGNTIEVTDAVSSLGIEFALQNKGTESSSSSLILSGLGIYTTVGSLEEPVPCRVKIYSAIIGDVADETKDYELALDTKNSNVVVGMDGVKKEVMCRGSEVETLISSDFFLGYYRQEHVGFVDVEDTASATAGDGPGRRLMRARKIQESSSSSETSNPLVIPPESILSLYVIVLPADESNDPIELLSKPGSEDFAEYTSNDNLALYEGSSIQNAFMLEATENGGSEEDVPEFVKPTVFMGAIYYDTLELNADNIEGSDSSSNSNNAALEEYYITLEESISDSLTGGCYGTLVTEYIDTVGSYGLMFDVTSMANGPFGSNTIVIYGMDVYIRSETSTRIEVYARTNKENDVEGNSGNNSNNIGNLYTSYIESEGQTRITEEWDLVAKGTVEGRGAGVGTPIPSSAWIKNIVIEPGNSVGLYVTVLDDPHLRYRNSDLSEGNVYSSDGILGIGVGRSWGEYPLKGDGTDVYFSQREFSGAFYYHAYDGVCFSEAPSVAPTTAAPVAASKIETTTSMPTPRNTPHVDFDPDHCDLADGLATTFRDGTGSFGSLFDVIAKRDLTITGLDMFIDWASGDHADVLIYARKGSWFGFQNDPSAWPYIVANTTIHRPSDFHNRTTDGPNIPLEKKKTSAMLPDDAFKNLYLQEGETWSLYVCTSMADMRYTLGSSIGKMFAENDELQIMEGAGAADWPPFGGASAGNIGAKEYTFYAPRVFNGNVRYEYKAECPSAPPSSAEGETPPPTPVPILTTSARYQFFVEHTPDRSASAISQDMEFAVNSVIDGFLKDVNNPLYLYALDDGLTISSLEASITSPAEIGYLCIPTPPNVCNLISVDVEASHRTTASTEDVKFALLEQATILPSLINVAGYEVEYVGERAVESDSEITLSGVPDRLMGEDEATYFGDVARRFLNNQVAKSKYGNGDGALKILSVSVNDQEITSETSVLEQGRSTRRLGKANNVKVKVKGQHRPPPELDLGQFVEDSINAEREAFDRELTLREPPTVAEDGTAVQSTPTLSYFDEVEVAGARDIREEVEEEAPMPVPSIIIQPKEDDGMKSILNMAAMGVGAMIIVLLSAFFLRPHRRAVIFGGISDDRQMYTQQIDEGDANFMQDDLHGSYTSKHAPDRKNNLYRSFQSSTNTGQTRNSSMVSNAGYSLNSSINSFPAGGQPDMRQSVNLPVAISNRNQDLRQSQQSYNSGRGYARASLNQGSLRSIDQGGFRSSQQSYGQSARY